MGNQSRVNPFGRDSVVTLPPVVRDRLGRTLVEGDVVLVDALPPTFVITKLQPTVDPQAPGNLMDITVQCRLVFRAARGDVAHEFTRVMTAEEARPPEAPTAPGSGLSLVKPDGEPV